MNIVVADFERDYAAIRRIRFAVFVDEQQVPRELEMDDRDVACTHWLATDERGDPIGTVRLDVEAGGKVGRLAVVAHARRRGVGRALMERVHEFARAQGSRPRVVPRPTIGRSVLHAARLPDDERPVRRSRHRARQDGMHAIDVAL